MATMIQFGRNMRKRALRMENNAVELTKRVAKRALRNLVEGTPVDKGVARSNWRASIYNPTRAVIPAYAPGRYLGRGERANARAAISMGIAQINLLKVGMQAGTGQAGRAVFLTNAIPYLTKLRNGSSSQQSEDWVSAALLDARTEIATAKLIER